MINCIFDIQSEEDHKHAAHMQDLVEKLQTKLRNYKRQIEEAEEIAALNLAKFRKAQQELEETEDRAKLADSAMSDLRMTRSGSILVNEICKCPNTY